MFHSEYSAQFDDQRLTESKCHGKEVPVTMPAINRIVLFNKGCETTKSNSKIAAYSLFGRREKAFYAPVVS